MQTNSNKFRTPTKEMIALGAAWAYFKAKASVLKPIVDKIQADLLDQLEINYDAKWAEMGDREAVGRITDPKYSYLMSEEDTARYYPALTAAYKAAGYDLPDGQCPYLVADHERIKAENALLDACADFLGYPELRADNLLHEYRDEVIQLHMGCLAPHIKREGY